MANKEDEKKWLETFLKTRNQSETSRRHGVPQSTLNKFLQSIPDLNKERYYNEEFEYWINLYFSGFGVTAISRITSRSRHTLTKFLKKFDVYEELFIYTKDIIEDFAKSKNATVEFPVGNINARTSLKWTCLEHNHTFLNAPSQVMGTRKQWGCVVCMGQKVINIQLFKHFAKEKGGKCLSKEYVNYKTNLEFECELGHRFSTTPAHIYDNKKPRWCSKCGQVRRYEEKKEFILKEVEKYLKDKGGTLLSIEQPIKTTSKTSIKCKNDHIFNPRVEKLIGKKKSWCQKKGCWNPPQKLTYELVKKTIEECGGTLISKNYSESKLPIKYSCNRCNTIHNRPFSYIRDKNKSVFCPNCDNSRFVDYGVVKKEVEDRGGILLSEEYVDGHTCLKIKCSNGHITDNLYWNAIHRGTWCEYCSKRIGQSITRAIIEAFFNEQDFKTIRPEWLRYKGNKLELDGYNEVLKIGFEYQGIQHYEKVYYQTDEKLRQLKLRDRSKGTKCKKRGVALILVKQFKSNIDKDEMIEQVKKSILRAGLIPLIKNPKVNFKKIYKYSELYEIKEAAIKHGGKLLSEAYLGSETKHEFICKYGHPFQLTPYNLLRKDVWCGNKKCKGERIRESSKYIAEKIIENFKAYCKSIDYAFVGTDTYIKPDGRAERLYVMHCRKNNHRNTSLRSFQIKKNVKCGKCGGELRSKISKMTIDDLNNYVKKYKGKCLAEKSRGHSIKLLWKCKNGHQWKDSPWQIVANNKWCEDC